MAQEKVAQYLISLGGDDSDLRTLFSSFKSRVRSDVAEIKAIADKLDLFGDLRTSLPQVERALDSAKQKAAQFADEIKRIESAGGKAPKELTQALEQAERAAASATRELQRQQQQLAQLDTQLSRAGVNTRNLATEQQRLGDASRAAAAAAELQAAKQTLGLRTVSDTTAEIARQRAAFDLLQKSGTLSATEIAAAQRALNAKIQEIEASVTGAGGSFRQLRADGQSAFLGIQTSVLATIGAVTAVTAAFTSVTGAAQAYSNGLAQVGTVTTLTDAQLKGLGLQARKLAEDLGIGVPDALKALYEIIRSGVPAQNSIEVLRLSARAAKADFTDTGTAAKAASVLMDGFGIELGGLGGAFDKLIASAKNGGPKLAEFAQSAGQLGNVARATGADFNEVLAALNVMTAASGDASGSIGVLTKSLIALGKPEVQGKLHELNLDGLSLVQTFRGLDAAGLKVNDFLQLGIANEKAAAGLTALINDAEKLPTKLQAITDSADTVSVSLAKMYDTPAERKKRFDSAWEETKIQIGEMVGANSNLLVVLNKILAVTNDYLAQQATLDEMRVQGYKNVFESIKSFLGLTEATKSGADGIRALADRYIELGAAQANVTAEIDKKLGRLTTLDAAITKNLEVLQKAVADEIATLTARAAQEIELLDKSAKSRESTATKTREIQAKLNKDISDALAKHYLEAQVAYEAHEKALAETGRKGSKTQIEIASETARGRLAALQPVLDGYEKHYGSLIKQSNDYKNTINKVEAERASIAETVEERARVARQAGMTDLQKYASDSREVDRLILKGREVAATEGYEASKKYFDQAIALSEKLKGEVLSDGQVVITQYQAEQASLAKSKRAAEAYNEALADAKNKAKIGADATDKELAETGDVIKSLRAELDAMKKTLTDAITVKISQNIEGIDAVRAQIADLVKPETKVITVVTVQANNGGGFIGSSVGLNAGGHVPKWKQYARAFADGGPVFRRPNWSKVPGVGNGDTVPALLQEGSFVVRKAASQLYGDGFMSRLARGYASGGEVRETDGVPNNAILAYGAHILQFLRGPYWTLTARAIGQEMKLLQDSNGRNQVAARNVLGWARNAANNYPLQDQYSGFAGSKPLTSFEAFFERWKKRQDNSAATGAGGASSSAAAMMANAAVSGPAFDWMRRMGFFASGGHVGTDTVPAMLTPGEWVIPKHVAKLYGGGFLHALNNGLIRPPQMPSAPIPRFAMGGPVGDVPMRGSSAIQQAGNTINVTINTPHPADDPKTLRRLKYALDKLETRRA